MRKTVKISAFILLISLLCVSLTGCNYIDELRQSQAICNESGSIILNDNTEYIPILVPENLEVKLDYTKSVYVADKDVPVLLLSYLGNVYTMSDNGFFIEGYTGYYCREDKYDFVQTLLINGYEPKGYSYDYYDYTLDKDITKQFTDEQLQVVETVLSKVAPTAIPEQYNIYWDRVIDVYSFGEEALFRRYEFELCEADGTYFIVANGNETYEIPNEYSELFDGMFEYI